MSLRSALCLTKIQSFFYYVIIGAAILFSLSNILQYYSIIPASVEIGDYISDINVDTALMAVGASAGAFFAKALSFR